MKTQPETATAAGTDVVPAQPDRPHHPPEIEEGGGGKLGILFAVIVLAVIGYGLHIRSAGEKTLAHETEEAAILSVSVVHPTAGDQGDDLSLPGNVQAFTEAPIYSRTNGYLKKWYFDIGAHVHKGDLLAEVETPEVDQQLNQTRAELERMQANANLAGVTSSRWQALVAKHAVSQQEADQTRSNLIAAQAAVDASEADVRRLEQLQSYERIVAPFDGVITQRNTDIGDLIAAGSGSSNPRALFQLVSSGPLRVYVSVPEVDSDSVHNGDTVTLTEDSEPSLKIPGKIVRNADAINETSRTLNVEVDVDNSKGVLRPGAFVFVHFHIPSAGSNSVTIPSNTLLFRAEGLRVGVVHGDRVQLKSVTIGHDYGNSVEILSGLAVGDSVILDPPDSLTSGTEVHPQMASNERGKQ